MPQAIDRSLATPMMRPRLPVISPRFSVISGTLIREVGRMSAASYTINRLGQSTASGFYCKDQRLIKGLALRELLPHVLIGALRFCPPFDRLLQIRVHLTRQDHDEAHVLIAALALWIRDSLSLQPELGSGVAALRHLQRHIAVDGGYGDLPPEHRFPEGDWAFE